MVVLRGASARAQVVGQKVAHAVGRGRTGQFVEAHANAAGVVQLPRLGGVPNDVVVAVHRKVLVVGNRKLELRIVHIAHLHDLLAPKDVGPNAHPRRREVEVRVANQGKGLRLQRFKRLYVYRRRLEGVGQASAVFVAKVLQRVGVAAEHFIERVRRAPVFDVPRPRFFRKPTRSRRNARVLAVVASAFGVHSVHGGRAVGSPAARRWGTSRGPVDAHVGKGHGAALLEVADHRTQRVFGRRGHQVGQGLGHFDVGIVGVEHRRLPILGMGHKDRQAQTALRRQEPVQVEVGLQVVVHRGELVSLVGRHVDAAESGGRESAAQGHLAEVRKLSRSAREARNAAAVVKVGHAQFVHPYFDALVEAVVALVGRTAARIAHADHNRAHPPQVGGAYNAVGAVADDALVGQRRRDVGIGLHGRVALELEGGPQRKLNVDVVGRRPDDRFVGRTPRGRRQRQFVLVVVLAVVVADAHKQADVAVAKLVGVAGGLSVHKELHALVHAHVDAGVFEDRPGVAVAKSARAHAQRLLVLLEQRGVAQQHLAAQARRHLVHHRHPSAVLLEVDGVDGKGGGV